MESKNNRWNSTKIEEIWKKIYRKSVRIEQIYNRSIETSENWSILTENFGKFIANLDQCEQILLKIDQILKENILKINNFNRNSDKKSRKMINFKRIMMKNIQKVINFWGKDNPIRPKTGYQLKYTSKK